MSEENEQYSTPNRTTSPPADVFNVDEDGNVVGSEILNTVMPDLQEMAALDILARLWPYIKHWPLCCADPAASDAVIQAAQLLGVESEYQQDANEDAYQEGFSEAVSHIAEVIAGLDLPKQIGPNLSKKILDAITSSGDGLDG